MWMADGDTKDKGNGHRAKGDESQTATHAFKSLAKQFHVSDNTIAQARDLLAEAPDLAAQHAGELRLRAEWKLGALVAADGERRGSPVKSQHGTLRSLPDGVDKHQSHRWRRMESAERVNQTVVVAV
jgi:hypothetical protein